MATYFFETITALHASTYDTTADTLVFGQTGERANTTTVLYNAATATSAATITLISGLTGKAVTFGNIAGETPIFPDASFLFVGTTNNDAQTGGTTGDALYGGAGTDSFVAGAGDDLFQGN